MLKVLPKEKIEAMAIAVDGLHQFIQMQSFFIESGSIINKHDTIFSLLGSFPPSLDQLGHWDYVPNGKIFLQNFNPHLL